MPPSRGRPARAQPQDDAVSGWLRRRCAVGATATAATAAAGRAAAVAVAVVRAAASRAAASRAAAATAAAGSVGAATVEAAIGANPQTSQLKIYLFGQCSTGLVLAGALLCFSS